MCLNGPDDVSSTRLRPVTCLTWMTTMRRTATETVTLQRPEETWLPWRSAVPSPLGLHLSCDVVRETRGTVSYLRSDWWLKTSVVTWMVVRQQGIMGKVVTDKTTLDRIMFLPKQSHWTLDSEETVSLLGLRFIDSRDAKHPSHLSAVFSFVWFLSGLRPVGPSGESLSLMETSHRIF